VEGKNMSAVIETNTATLMGRERYASRHYNVSTGAALYSHGIDRSQWERCFQKLAEIQNYEQDWNDDGAMPITAEVIALAKQLAKSLRSNLDPAPTHTLATDDGSIIFVWDEAKEYIEIEVERNHLCTMRRVLSGAKRALSMDLNPTGFEE
jgi:hypothetical protein